MAEVDQVTRLLDTTMRYGNHNGRNWTSAEAAYAYTEAGVDKKFTSADRAVVGVDNYDHFVAKAHDYNEVVAIDVLRIELADL